MKNNKYLLSVVSLIAMTIGMNDGVASKMKISNLIYNPDDSSTVNSSAINKTTPMSLSTILDNNTNTETVLPSNTSVKNPKKRQSGPTPLVEKPSKKMRVVEANSTLLGTEFSFYDNIVKACENINVEISSNNKKILKEAGDIINKIHEGCLRIKKENPNTYGGIFEKATEQLSEDSFIQDALKSALKEEEVIATMGLWLPIALMRTMHTVSGKPDVEFPSNLNNINMKIVKKNTGVLRNNPFCLLLDSDQIPIKYRGNQKDVNKFLVLIKEVARRSDGYTTLINAAQEQQTWQEGIIYAICFKSFPNEFVKNKKNIIEYKKILENKDYSNVLLKNDLIKNTEDEKKEVDITRIILIKKSIGIYDFFIRKSKEGGDFKNAALYSTRKANFINSLNEKDSPWQAAIVYIEAGCYYLKDGNLNGVMNACKLAADLQKDFNLSDTNFAIEHKNYYVKLARLYEYLQYNQTRDHFASKAIHAHTHTKSGDELIEAYRQVGTVLKNNLTDCSDIIYHQCYVPACDASHGDQKYTNALNELYSLFTQPQNRATQFIPLLARSVVNISGSVFYIQ